METSFDVRFDTCHLETVKVLGRGAFGEVFLVKVSPLDNSSDTPAVELALKRTSLVQLSGAGHEQALAEAKLLQRLGEEHMSILRCFDSRVTKNTLELLLEFASLGDLSGRIRAARSDASGQGAGLSESELVSYGADVAAGLAHLHGLRPKVFHRDVKPANVVLFPAIAGRGALPRAKLADFGIAKIMEGDSSFAGAATVIGTPLYFSPEICRGERYDERADAWAFGVVIYEMMCLHRPFHQAEGNLAVLAVRISEGRYDRDALARKAGSYNGLLVFTLMGLLALDPEQRLRAKSACETLDKLKTEVGETDAAASDVARWMASMASPTCQSTAPQQVEGTRGSTLDSWCGAQELLKDEVAMTQKPLQDSAVTRLPEDLEEYLCPDVCTSRNEETKLYADTANDRKNVELTQQPPAQWQNFTQPLSNTRTSCLSNAHSDIPSEHACDTEVLNTGVFPFANAAPSAPVRVAWFSPPADQPHQPAASTMPQTPVSQVPVPPKSPTATRLFMRPLWPKSSKIRAVDAPMIFRFVHVIDEDIDGNPGSQASTCEKDKTGTDVDDSESDINLSSKINDGWLEVKIPHRGTDLVAWDEAAAKKATDGIFGLTSLE